MTFFIVNGEASVSVWAVPDFHVYVFVVGLLQQVELKFITIS